MLELSAIKFWTCIKMLLFRQINYFCREAWQNFARGGLMSLIAASTITISLFIFGVFLLVFLNLYNLAGTLNTKLDIMVYLQDNISKNDIDILNMTIGQIAGVRKIEFVSKAEAWRQFRENYSTLRLDEFMDDNPLPDSFKVEVIDLSFIHLTANQLRTLNGVDEVNYGSDLAERMAVFIRIISLAGAVIIFLLFSSTLMIVVNTIRLTVVARENEINIMSLVGASRSFVKYPFIFEGMLLGLLSSTLSMVLLRVGYRVVTVRLERLLPLLPINLNSTEINLVFLLVFFTGIFLGWLGSYFSVSKTLKQE